MKTLIKENLGNNFDVREKRPGIYQLIAPFYHEDGDMIDIFLEYVDESKTKIKISDYGMTMMRLSYTFDLDTPNREKVFNKIIHANRLHYSNGNLFIETDMISFQPALMQFIQTIIKVTNMKLYQREIIQNLFFEQLDEVVQTKLNQYVPVSPFYPIPEHDEYEVNYCFNHRKRPIYLFGVNNPANAKLVTISCLKFLNENINFQSIIVLESIDVVTKNDLARLMSAADKEFPSLEDFTNNAEFFFKRELRG